MSNKREREKRREQRLQEETKVESQDRRTRLLQFGAGAVLLAIVIVVVLIVVNSGSSDGGGGDAENLVEVSEVQKLFTGIEQEGLTLGDPKAPVELLEYGDLQCPVCKQYSEEVLPPIIDSQVKQGQAKISFHNFVIIGPESYPAGQAAIAAGEQGVGWSFTELFYRNQGKENSGYVTDKFLTAVAEGAGVKDIQAWNKARNGSKTKEEVEASSSEASNKFHFNATPSFAIKGPGTNGIELLGTPGSTEAIEEAIDAAS
jgi:protein-disulfide isomerase